MTFEIKIDVVNSNRAVMLQHNKQVVAERWAWLGVAENDERRSVSTPFNELFKIFADNSEKMLQSLDQLQALSYAENFVVPQSLIKNCAEATTFSTEKTSFEGLVEKHRTLISTWHTLSAEKNKLRQEAIDDEASGQQWWEDLCLIVTSCFNDNDTSTALEFCMTDTQPGMNADATLGLA